MELKEFISSAISDIAEAIKEADDVLKKSGGLVNPGENYSDLVGKKFRAPSTQLNFDVAVTASSSGKASAGAKAKIFVVEASIGGEGQLSKSNVSRLTFSLDVVFPHDQEQDKRVGWLPNRSK